MNTLVKMKIVVSQNKTCLTAYFWKRKFLCLGYWYPYGTASMGKIITDERIRRITDDLIAKAIYDNFIPHN